MRIVHVISALTKGGGERMAAELANIAAEKGNEVTILAAWPVDPAFLQDSISKKISIKFVAGTRRSAFLNIIPWIIKNRSWLNSQDVLHCHLTYGTVFGSAAYIILKKIFRRKRPVIVETNHAVGMPVPKSYQKFQSRMLLMRNGVAMMANDPYWDNFTQKHPELSIKMIPNGISIVVPDKSPDSKKRMLENLGIPDCRFIVGTIGMLRPDRKPSLYIPIFKRIHDAFGKDVHFIIGGDGSELEKIKTLIRESGLTEQVHMPGLVAMPAPVISLMDAYVSISVGKTTGISMMEAAMCDVPVTGIQLVEDYQAKDDDWVWSHTDLDKVADKIIFLLEHKNEKNQLAAAQSRYAHDHFTSEKMFSSYYDFYKSLLNSFS